MSWIDRRMEDLDAWKRRNALIRREAAGSYDFLWTEIKDRLDEAKEKGFAVSASGGPGRRTISLEKQNNSGVPFEVEIKLVDGKERIRASGDRVDLFLDFDVCPENVVCLKYEGRRVTIEEAAFIILDRFLFPQLQK